MSNYKERDILDCIDEFFKNIDISLAELEKVGTIFISFGYSTIFYSANLDILEAKDINNTNIIPSETTLLGQKYIALGYVILWIVSVKRLQQVEDKNKYKKNKTPTYAYRLVVKTYLISVFANLTRLEAFNEINKLENSDEFID